MLKSTGASPSELIDLERRIADRGLQLRGVHGVSGDDGRPICRAIPNATALTHYEETQIRVALLFMAERLGNDLWRNADG